MVHAEWASFASGGKAQQPLRTDQASYCSTPAPRTPPVVGRRAWDSLVAVLVAAWPRAGSVSGQVLTVFASADVAPAARDIIQLYCQNLLLFCVVTLACGHSYNSVSFHPACTCLHFCSCSVLPAANCRSRHNPPVAGTSPRCGILGV